MGPILGMLWEDRRVLRMMRMMTRVCPNSHIMGTMSLALQTITGT
jgi:hypothetical protein